MAPPKKKKKDESSWQDKLSRIRRKAGSLAARHGLSEGYRSGLEVKAGKLLTTLGIPFRFEAQSEIIQWVPLPTPHKYHPDFVIEPNGERLTFIIETKGRFMPDDMQKHLAIKIQHPQKDIRFVFQNPKGWHRKAVKMSYALWCDKHGFKYCGIKDFEKVIKEWIVE